MVQQQRARPRHAVANDATLQAAAVDQIAESGWDAMTMVKVATAAELTYGASYARFPDKTALGLDLWRSTLGPALESALADVADALTIRSADASGSLELVARPNTTLLAAIELLQAAYFDPRLRAGIWDDLAAWLRPEGASASADAVRAAGNVVSLGLLLLARRSWVAGLDLTSEWHRYARAFRAPIPAVPLPAADTAYLREGPFATGDDRLDRVLSATADEVARRGFRGATISRICRAGGASPTYLYQRWPNKLALVSAAADALLARGLHLNADFLERVTRDHGRGIAEALIWHAHSAPDLITERAIILELNRLACFEASIAAVHEQRERPIVEASAEPAMRAFAHTEIALGLGVVLMAQLVPAMHTLPFDVVTVPLAEGSAVLSLPAQESISHP